MNHGEELAEVALSYLKLGVGIVLMRVNEAGNKKPLIRWKSGGLRTRGVLDRLSRDDIDESVVLAVVTGEELSGGGYLVGVDADTYKPGVAEALDHLNLPATATSVTPRGGLHLLFQSSRPFETFTRRDGIEIKALDALLTMPPGHGAHWLVDEDRQILDPFSFEIAEMPDSIFEDETRRYDIAENVNRETFVDLEELCVRVSLLRQGNRHSGLLSIAGFAFSLVRSGFFAKKVVYTRLLESAIAVGLEPSEAERVISWARDNDKGRAGGAYQLVVRESEKEILRFLAAQLKSHQWSDIFSARYVSGALGIPKSTVSDCLRSLLNRKLLWDGGTKRLQDGIRPARRYGVTKRGFRFLEEQSL